MSDISTLGIAVDSSGVRRATDELQRMATAGKTAEGAADALAASSNSLADAAGAVSSATGATANHIGQVTSAANKATGALNQLTKAHRAMVLESNNQPKIPVAPPAPSPSPAPAPTPSPAPAPAPSGKYNGISDKQANAAIRGLPAQLTDVFTQLAGGANPLLVLIQQGGQVKDQFHGIGNALTGLRSVLTPTVAGLTAVAGAAALAGYSAYNASQDSQALRRALILTGGSAGATAGDFRAMAQTVASATGQTIGASREITASLASNGQMSAAALQSTALAIAALADVSDQSAADIGKKLSKAFDDPAKAAVELNNEMHFLSVAQYEQIRAAQEAGDKSKAVEIAMNALALTVRSRTITEMSALSAISDGVVKGFSSIADGIGRWLIPGFESAADRAATLRKEIAALTKAKAGYEAAGGASNGASAFDAKLASKQKELAALDNRAAAAKEATKAQAEQDEILRARQAVREKYKTRADKKEDAFRELDKGKFDPAEYAKLRKQIEEQYKEPKGAKAPRVDLVDKAQFADQLSTLKLGFGEAQQSYQQLLAAGVVTHQQYTSAIGIANDAMVSGIERAYQAQVREIEAAKGGTKDREELRRLDNELAKATRGRAHALEEVGKQMRARELQDYLAQVSYLRDVQLQANTVGLQGVDLAVAQMRANTQLTEATKDQAEAVMRLTAAKTILFGLRQDAADAQIKDPIEAELAAKRRQGLPEADTAEARSLLLRKRAAEENKAQMGAQEKYAARMSELNAMQSEGLSDDAYQKASVAAWQELAANVDRAKLTMSGAAGVAAVAGLEIRDELGTMVGAVVTGEYRKIGDVFDQVVQKMITRAITSNLEELLFGGTKAAAAPGAGSGGGLAGLLSSAASALFGSPAGARADGGAVAAGRVYKVNERGAETFTVDGEQFLIPHANGRVNKAGGSVAAGGTSVQVNIVNSGSPVQVASQRTSQGSNGTIVDIVLKAVADDVAKGGVVAGAMQTQYGLNRAAGTAM